MILFYSLGGGWGHLRRTHVFIQNEGITGFKVLTSNPLAERMFDKEQVVFCKNVPPTSLEEHMEFVNNFLEDHNVEALYVDVFPMGIMGELSMLTKRDMEKHLLCRRLKWESYEKHTGGNDLMYDRALVLEPLEEAHVEYLKKHSRERVEYSLEYPPANLPDEPGSALEGEALWLIVHGANAEETGALCRYAKEMAVKEKHAPNLVLVSDCEIDEEGIEGMSIFPASDLFPLADRLFTGCGFNIMQETAPYRDKQVCMPFPRKYDDQFWRLGRQNK